MKTRPLFGILVLFLASTIANAETNPGICDELLQPGIPKALFGLCTAYCQAIDWQPCVADPTSPECNGLVNASEKVLASYNKKAPEGPQMPCVSQGGATCPCDDLMTDQAFLTDFNTMWAYLCQDWGLVSGWYSCTSDPQEGVLTETAEQVMGGGTRQWRAIMSVFTTAPQDGDPYTICEAKVYTNQANPPVTSQGSSYSYLTDAEREACINRIAPHAQSHTCYPDCSPV